MVDDDELQRRVLEEEKRARERAATEEIPGLPPQERKRIADGEHTANPDDLAREIERRGG